MSSEFDLIEPCGRRHRFRRKRLGDHLPLAAAVVSAGAIWAILLWPVVQWLTR
jgi:hypothetical protein